MCFIIITGFRVVRVMTIQIILVRFMAIIALFPPEFMVFQLILLIIIKVLFPYFVLIQYLIWAIKGVFVQVIVVL